jgi:hypothetical protein
MALAKYLQAAVLSTSLVLSPWMAQSAVAQSTAVGAKEAGVPPKIVTISNQSAWNDPSAFGPVPQDKIASGNATCQSMGFASAIGYHSKAQDLGGRAFPGGGYFCEGKATVASVDAPATTSSATPVTGSTAAPVGSSAATAAASGGLTTAAIIGGVVIVGAAIAIAASGGGGSGSTGTTGTVSQ